MATGEGRVLEPSCGKAPPLRTQRGEIVGEKVVCGRFFRFICTVTFALFNRSACVGSIEIHNMKTISIFKGAALAACTLWALTACKDDEEQIVAVPLEKPAIALAAEKQPNPIVLEFAWSAVEHAGGYEYRLDDAQGKTLASGSVSATTLELPASNLIPVQSGTTYNFAVRAVSADEQHYSASDFADKSVVTAPSDFKLSISNVTYRTADMFCETADEQMKFYLTYISLERYAEYGDDETLFEEYEKGYAKAAGPGMGVPWYMFMEGMAKSGASYGFHTGALTPDTDYYMYAYGIKANVEAFDIDLITEIEKIPFRTLPWQATIDCTFGIKLGTLTADNMTFTVEPSKEGVTYYFGVVPVALVESEYKNDMDALTRNILYQMEAIAKVNWDDPGVLLEGTKTINFGPDQIAGFNSGAAYYALAFGVDTQGLQTTVLSKITFDVPVIGPEPAAAARKNRMPEPPLLGADRALAGRSLLIF